MDVWPSATTATEAREAGPTRGRDLSVGFVTNRIGSLTTPLGDLNLFRLNGWFVDVSPVTGPPRLRRQRALQRDDTLDFLLESRTGKACCPADRAPAIVLEAIAAAVKPSRGD